MLALANNHKKLLPKYPYIHLGHLILLLLTICSGYSIYRTFSPLTPPSKTISSQKDWPLKSSFEFDDFKTTTYLTNKPVQPKREDFPDYIQHRLGIHPDYESNYTFDLNPNFAGHLWAFVIGCGTNCKMLYFVDLRNGEFLASMAINFSCGMSDDSPDIYQPEHSIDSRLLIIPCVVGNGGEGLHYFEYTEGKLSKLMSKKWDTDWNDPNR